MCSKIEFSKLIAKGLGGQSYLISQVSSEQNILHINMLLTTPGIHSLKINGEFTDARIMIIDHLKAILLIKNPAYVAVESAHAPGIENVLPLIKNSIDQESYDSFFYTFNHDFLWVEITDELIKSDWFLSFYQSLIDYKISDNIPVIFIM